MFFCARDACVVYFYPFLIAIFLREDRLFPEGSSRRKMFEIRKFSFSRGEFFFKKRDNKRGFATKTERKKGKKNLREKTQTIRIVPSFHMNRFVVHSKAGFLKPFCNDLKMEPRRRRRLKFVS